MLKIEKYSQEISKIENKVKQAFEDEKKKRTMKIEREVIFWV